MASTNHIYGLGTNASASASAPILDMYNESDQERAEQVKWELLSWLVEITKDADFQRRFIRSHILTSEEERARVLQYVVWCANELLGTLIDSLNGRVNLRFLQAMGAACLIVALKLLGGHDWLNPRGLYDYMTYLCSGTATKAHLLEMESDILARTNWKGCEIARISEENILLGGKRKKRRQTRRRTLRTRTRTRKNHKKS